MARIRNLLSLRLKVGTIMIFLALVPMLGLAGLATIQALEVAQTRGDLNDVEASTVELLILVELEVAVVDEIYWSEAKTTTSRIGIPPLFINTTYGLDIDGRLQEARDRVDRLLGEARNSELTLAFNTARRANDDAIDGPIVNQDSPISLFAGDVLRPVVAQRTAEVVQAAPTIEDSSDLVEATRILDKSNTLRGTSVELIRMFFFVNAFGIDEDDDTTLRRLSTLRENYEAQATELDQLIDGESAINEAWQALRANEPLEALLQRTDDVLRDGAVSPLIEGGELNPQALGSIGQAFAEADGAGAAQLRLLESVANEVENGVQLRRDAADRNAWLIGTAVVAISIITLTSALISTRSIVRPLSDLARAADLLRTGDNSASVSVRGPEEVRTVAEALNEAVANLRRAEFQALALADGRLDDLNDDDVAFGTLGSSLSAAVERLRVSLGEREEYRRRLAHEASHDGLTGVPNRSASIEHLDGALARAERLDSDVAVLFVDLDNFKQVNDLRGHAAGDRLLREVSRRLIRSCRDGDLVGRIGGDEFLVIAEPVEDEAEVRILSQRLLDAVSAPFEDEEGTTTPSASIGAALAGGRRRASDVVHDADLAVYEAKEAGRGRTAFCDDEMRSRLLAEADLDSAIRNGLSNDEFKLFFQPTFNLHNGELDGAEALIRWDREGVGQMRPDRFIPFAERTDLISEIDSWVMARALTHLAAWADDEVLNKLSLAVNVSGRHLLRGDLTREVTAALEKTGADPKLLTIEVTESALLDDFTTAGRHLTALRDLGIRVAIDDFGTGYTSLSHLRQLPVDVLKVDRTFTSNLHRSDDLSLVKLVIDTGHLLGHEITVEGVEGEKQEEVLRGLGADRLQGFRFGQPMDEDDLVDHLRNPVQTSIDQASESDSATTA